MTDDQRVRASIERRVRRGSRIDSSGTMGSASSLSAESLGSLEDISIKKSQPLTERDANTIVQFH
jgi:hypothetical protein